MDGHPPRLVATSAIRLFPFPEFLDCIEANNLLSVPRLRAHFARQSSEFLGDPQTFRRSPGEVRFEPFETGGFEWVSVRWHGK